MPQGCQLARAPTALLSFIQRIYHLEAGRVGLLNIPKGNSKNGFIFAGFMKKL